MQQTKPTKAQRYYTALQERWRQERMAGSEPPPSHDSIALNLVANDDAEGIAQLGKASNDRRTWAELQKQYATAAEVIGNRFRRATSPDLRELYGQPPLTAGEYAAAYAEACRAIRTSIDEPIYAEYLHIQYLAEAHAWLKKRLRLMWRLLRPNTNPDHLVLDLDLLGPATLVGLCAQAELDFAAIRKSAAPIK